MAIDYTKLTSAELLVMANDKAKAERESAFAIRYAGRNLGPKDSMEVESVKNVVGISVDTSQIVPTISASGKSVTYCAGYCKDVMIDGMKGYARVTLGIYNRDFNLVNPNTVDTSSLKS